MSRNVIENEQEIRNAFNEEFSHEYLSLLDNQSTARNSLIELLWMGFAHGYRKAKENDE